jgi:hypothetical protein
MPQKKEPRRRSTRIVLEKIRNRVTIAWDFGEDVGHPLKHMENPVIPEPKDMTADEEKVKWRKKRLWDQDVDRHRTRCAALEENKGAMCAVVMDGVSKIIRSKLKSKTGCSKADEMNDSLWLLETLEDSMVNFEEIKPKILAIDDQMERIMKLKQGESTNEDFLKQAVKELKVHEKHGGNFLWGNTQETELNVRVADAKLGYRIANRATDGTPSVMPEDQIKDQTAIAKKALKEVIVAMAVLKRADKKRHGNLQISLKNSYLLGKNDNPTNIPDMLKVLNNCKSEWTPGTAQPTAARTGGRNQSYLQSTAGEVFFMRATNNSFSLRSRADYAESKVTTRPIAQLQEMTQARDFHPTAEEGMTLQLKLLKRR